MVGKIGIFDSGVGGLTTLKALREALPLYDYHYLADTARAPYGARGQNELLQYIQEAAYYLRTQGCTLVIIACNTASTYALKVLQEELTDSRDTFRMLGILTPVVECAIATTKNNRIGVIATQSTVESNKYPREVAKFTNKITVFQQAVPTLATLIEHDSPEVEVRAALAEAIAPLLEIDIDTLVLGCTHYGHVAHIVRDMVPPHVQTVHEGMCIADSLRDYLVRHTEFARALSRSGSCVIETTKKSTSFIQFADTAVPGTPVYEVHITHTAQM